jgi:glycine cleavage system H protein
MPGSAYFGRPNGILIAMSNIPAELHYTKSHEWVRLEDGTATVGITDHAQAELGDVVYVDLPEVGRVLQAGEAFGSIESVKAVSELYAPLAGQVLEVNPILTARSELVNSDPYGQGFLVKLKLGDSEGGEPLLSAAEYEKTLA